jgi:hypothetical protein
MIKEPHVCPDASECSEKGKNNHCKVHKQNTKCETTNDTCKHACVPYIGTPEETAEWNRKQLLAEKKGVLTRLLLRHWGEDNGFNSLPLPFKGYLWKHLPLGLYIIGIFPYLLVYVFYGAILQGAARTILAIAVTMPVEYFCIPLLQTLFILATKPDGEAWDKICDAWYTEWYMGG